MSIEKKLTYLKDTKALIRKKLNRFGINVSSENTFRSYVDFLDEILNRYPKSRGQGTEVTLENTIEAPFTEFDVEGNSTQETTEGYQLLKYPYVISSTTVEGVTFTDNGDGSIKINGTASKEARFNLQWDNKVPAGSYSYIVFNLPNNCFANYYTIGNKYGEDVGNRTSDTEINLGSSIVVPAGVTVSNVTVYPMLVSGTYTRETIPNWEKYTNGASPNPNYEQPIESAGDNGSINEKILNKNFWSLNSSYSSTGYATLLNQANFKLKKGNYILSFEKVTIASSILFRFFNKDKSSYYDARVTPTSKTPILNALEDIYYVTLIFNEADSLEGIQLEPGSTATPYIPHEEQDYSIFVQQPFRSIGDVRDCFVKKSDGKLYERHYIGRKIFDGSEDEGWRFNATSTTPSNRTVIITNNNLNSKYNVNADYLSNMFIKNSTSSNKFVLSAGLYLSLDDSLTGITSNDDNNVRLTKMLTYLSTHNAVVQYELAEPLDLSCTEEQIQQLENKPSTYKDFTYVVSEDETPAYLEVAGLKED